MSNIFFTSWSAFVLVFFFLLSLSTSSRKADVPGIVLTKMTKQRKQSPPLSDVLKFWRPGVWPGGCCTYRGGRTCDHSGDTAGESAPRTCGGGGSCWRTWWTPCRTRGSTRPRTPSPGATRGARTAAEHWPRSHRLGSEGTAFLGQGCLRSARPLQSRKVCHMSQGQRHWQGMLQHVI